MLSQNFPRWTPLSCKETGDSKRLGFGNSEDNRTRVKKKQPDNIKESTA